MEIIIPIVHFLSFCLQFVLKQYYCKIKFQISKTFVIDKNFFKGYTQFCMEIKRNYTQIFSESYTKIRKITRKFCKIKTPLYKILTFAKFPKSIL